MVSVKQLQANRRNAKKSTGPKTKKGKALACRNSLKHGLLAKEVVIDAGEGAEDPQEFEALLNDLIDYYQPVGPIEEMLVEKIAASIWQNRRALRFEVGILREQLDNPTDKYYDDACHKPDIEIDEEIEKLQQKEKASRGDLPKVKKLFEQNKDLSEIYDREDAWKWLHQETLEPPGLVIRFPNGHKIVIDPPKKYTSPEDVRKDLYKKGYTDEMIWKAHIALCEKNSIVSNKIEKLKKEKINNKLSLQRLKKTGSLPDKGAMDNLLRYETAIDNKLYKAINQLERLQRRRLGDHVPPPIQVDVETHGTRDIKFVPNESMS